LPRRFNPLLPNNSIWAAISGGQ